MRADPPSTPEKTGVWKGGLSRAPRAFATCTAAGRAHSSRHLRPIRGSAAASRGHVHPIRGLGAGDRRLRRNYLEAGGAMQHHLRRRRGRLRAPLLPRRAVQRAQLLERLHADVDPIRRADASHAQLRLRARLATSRGPIPLGTWDVPGPARYKIMLRSLKDFRRLSPKCEEGSPQHMAGLGLTKLRFRRNIVSQIRPRPPRHINKRRLKRFSKSELCEAHSGVGIRARLYNPRVRPSKEPPPPRGLASRTLLRSRPVEPTRPVPNFACKVQHRRWKDEIAKLGRARPHTHARSSEARPNSGGDPSGIGQLWIVWNNMRGVSTNSGLE